MNIGVRLLQVAACYMIAGLVMGLGMGMSGNFGLASVHSHVLLLGWTTMGITGIVYLLLPGCSRSRLARLHFWGHNAGLPVMMVSLALFTYGVTGAEKAVAAGGTLVLLSLLMFAINLFVSGGWERTR